MEARGIRRYEILSSVWKVSTTPTALQTEWLPRANFTDSLYVVYKYIFILEEKKLCVYICVTSFNRRYPL